MAEVGPEDGGRVDGQDGCWVGCGVGFSPGAEGGKNEVSQIGIEKLLLKAAILGWDVCM